MEKIIKGRKNLQFYSTHDISDQEINSVTDVLQSDFLSRGPKVVEFEAAIGSFCKGAKALAVNSATSALHLAYILAGVNESSLVWTSPITFVATANTAMQMGAKMDFVDINSETLNICPEILESKLREAKQLNRLPHVVTAVHFGGNPCDMDAIYTLSKKYGFTVIEDASHALGASYNGAPIGGDERSLASIFSFHPVKMITTGEGGALIVGTEAVWQKADIMRSHGVNNLSDERNKKDMCPWYYEQTEIGYNYRMTEMQAAMGTVQIARLPDFVIKRNKLANLYKNKLANFPLKFQTISKGSISSYHLFTIELKEKSFDRDRLYQQLKEKRIASQVHYIPLYYHPFYKNLGFRDNYCKNAERYFSSCLSIPLHQKLDEDDIDYVVEHITEFLK